MLENCPGAIRNPRSSPRHFADLHRPGVKNVHNILVAKSNLGRHDRALWGVGDLIQEEFLWWVRNTQTPVGLLSSHPATLGVPWHIVDPYGVACSRSM